jgi:hypothetical protein
VVITISYIYINFISIKSSNQVNQGAGNKMINRRNAKMQRKISVIITTDFLCWIPFVTICVLLTCEVLDDTPWYALFSIIILPINSVINPILYDDTVTSLIDKATRKFKDVWNPAYAKCIKTLGECLYSQENLEAAGDITPEEQPCGNGMVETRGL